MSRREAIQFLVVAIIWIVHAWALQGPVEDDSFISYRYAVNLAKGHGLTYNPGERVEGYTNFLWTVLAAGGVGLLKIDPLAWSVALGQITGLATIMLLFLLTRQWVRGFAGVLPPLLFALNSGVVYSYVNGMETGLFALLVVAALVLLGHVVETGRKAAVLGITLLLASLCRPEGNLLAVFVIGTFAWRGMFLVREGRGAGLAVALWYAVGNAAYLAWRKAYYGFWLPNTFYAKVGATYAQVLRGWDYVLWFFAGLGVLVLMMVLAGVAFSRHREGLARPMTFAVVYLLLILGVGGDYNEYPRFFIPILPVIYVVCAVGLDGILGGVRRKTGATVAFSIGLLIAVAAAGESLHASHPIREYARGRLRRMEFMRSVGTWAAENTSKDASIACKYIGVVGYYSGRTILDMHGLTNLHIGHKKMESFGSGMAGHEKTDVDYVLAQSPDYLFVNLKQRAGGGEDADFFMDTEKILALYEQKEARTGDIRFYYYARR